MRLYGYWRSSSAWRVRLVLAHKGLPYEYRAVNLIEDGGGAQNTAGYRALNASRTVPLLELEDGNQVHRLAQSMAIIEFLEERFPQQPIFPRDSWLRARVRMMAEHINSGIQPYQNVSVSQFVSNVLHQDALAWTRHWIERGLPALEEWVSGEPGDFCVGGTLSLADMFLIPQLYASRRVNVELSKFPKLLRIEAKCQALPAFIAAHADNQPDAPVKTA